MRYCPSCQTTYADDSLQFCLQDGTSLLVYSGESSQIPTQSFGETETVVRQNPITSDWEQSRVTQAAALRPEAKKPGTLLAVMLTALIMFVFFAGAAGLWLLLNGGSSEISSNTNETVPSPSLTPRINRTPDVNSGGTDWGPVNNQASLNGERLTYYRGTTAEQCMADCDENPKCKAFGLIRAGAYNPNDPPMCYLLSKVTDIVTHSCCISAIKAEETLKACGYSLSAVLYDKWKQMGGESGRLGCPTMDETEAESSPQGTTGRMTQFSKGDGGYIIRHNSGSFSGTAFEVSGCMFKLYANIGGAGSWLGFPVKDGSNTSTGARQDFEGGYILWDAQTYECQAYKN